MAQENARKRWKPASPPCVTLAPTNYDDIVIRDLINRGAMVGPRMFVAGFGLTATSEPFKPEMQPQCGQADGVPEVLKAVRERVAAGVDVIKVYGSTGSDKDVSGYQTFTMDEMNAAVEAAHKFGKRVATHSYGPDGARDGFPPGPIPWSTPSISRMTYWPKW
jgi:imidazolonepropionase-like amidohydrolase